MKYRDGYKYQLTEQLLFETDIRPGRNVRSRWVELDKCGILRVREGFAWDGASGPVFDRLANMRGGCIHDALYYLMRNGHIPRNLWRAADLEYAKALREDGAWRITVAVDLFGLKLAAGRAAHPRDKKRILTAP